MYVLLNFLLMSIHLQCTCSIWCSSFALCFSDHSCVGWDPMKYANMARAMISLHLNTLVVTTSHTLNTKRTLPSVSYRLAMVTLQHLFSVVMILFS